MEELVYAGFAVIDDAESVLTIQPGEMICLDDLRWRLLLGLYDIEEFDFSTSEVEIEK